MSSPNSVLNGVVKASKCPVTPSDHWWRLSWLANPDVYGAGLLVAMYALQGIPMGLTFGTLPFLLQSRSSLVKLGIFSVASYPYSLKLLWSPLVDAVYWPRLGRRKSWIVPTQLLMGSLLLALSTRVEHWVRMGTVMPVTLFCFVLVFLAATQDVAVDGWALTLLSEGNASYASMCQSLGLSVGYFSSFTMFLALNNPSFCRHWLGIHREVFTLASFLRLTGTMFLLLTVLLALGVRERERRLSAAALPQRPPHVRATLRRSYGRLGEITAKAPVRQLLAFLLLSKFGFAVHDNVSSLQLLRRGFPRQHLAFMAVLQMPFDVLGALAASKRARASPNLYDGPWRAGFFLRLAIALLTPPVLCYVYPAHTTDGVPLWFYLTVFFLGLVYQFASDSVMFVSTGTFFARISDPRVGGTYLTLLNTASNLGGTWPKPLVFFLADRFGYLPVATALPLLGWLLYAVYLRRALLSLRSVPRNAWLLQDGDESRNPARGVS
ncbi:hypothetical protein CDCA_CDCA07G2154 [Cyanidium caldarium]|uniref:Acetyl-CoA transporter n=1 Tax=Cyanidium caldarium TaxID=2771 RepID=A0AAV9IV15_CYACA|nr:hypothetical protein CDCA_CDCA07G2154 [Cyanidium caldarium]